MDAKKLYEQVILISAILNFFMSKTQLQHFVDVNSADTWWPASNLQSAGVTKL